eukprot:TRINITY_DN26643_c0_g1_i1.p1 TRINITY_DN26643_c0_g1~~TRINITY_DN26643_c0_g1_i1.p1  ORF type:complete len:477 (+),score=91.83 TRINITY_DN26643_c0_g1_i1:97-1527(+)
MLEEPRLMGQRTGTWRRREAMHSMLLTDSGGSALPSISKGELRKPPTVCQEGLGTSQVGGSDDGAWQRRTLGSGPPSRSTSLPLMPRAGTTSSSRPGAVASAASMSATTRSSFGRETSRQLHRRRSRGGVLPDNTTEADGGASDRRRPTTADFWQLWCEESGALTRARGGWSVSRTSNSSTDELSGVMKAAKTRDQAEARAKWLSATFSRLQSAGYSDSKCRELLIQQAQAKGERVSADGERPRRRDREQDTASEVRRTFDEMREQHRVLLESRSRLEEAMLSRVRVETCEQVTSPVTMALRTAFRRCVAGEEQVHERQLEDKPHCAPTGCLKFVDLAEELGFPGCDTGKLEKLFSQFYRFCNTEERLTRKGFGDLVTALSGENVTMSKADIQVFWSEMERASEASCQAPAAGANAASPRTLEERWRSQVCGNTADVKDDGEDTQAERKAKTRPKTSFNFDDFSRWYFRSELYVPA